MISQWKCQWKMLFTPEPAKAVCFLHKRDSRSHQLLTFKNNKMQFAPSVKHLGLMLDSKLDFSQHIDKKNK